MGEQKQFWNNEYLINASFVGVNNENNLLLNNQINQTKAMSVFTDGREYSQSLLVNSVLKESKDKPSLGLVFENYFTDNFIKRKNTFGIILTTSFFKKNIEIRPAVNIGIRYDYQDLNNLFEMYPSFFDSIKPLDNIKQITPFINASLLIEHKRYRLGFSIFNINSPEIYIINEKYRAHLKSTFYFSKKICIDTKNRDLQFNPYILFINNYNPTYLSAVGVTLYNRYQLTLGINIEGKKNIGGFQLGYYPAAYKYFIGSDKNFMTSIKEVGLLYSRKINKRFNLQYSLNIVCHSSFSVFSFFNSRLTSIYLHNICLNYHF